jgi:hypothetical protein
MTTTGAADIIFGSVALASGITTLLGGASTILTIDSGRDILFQGGAGAYNFTTFNEIDFNALSGTIKTSPLGASIYNFASVSTIMFEALNGIALAIMILL